MNQSDDAKLIDWQLRWIRENAGELTEGELKLIISFEDQYLRNGRLSPAQMEILEEIYTRRT